ncbi:ABC transporter ATP-binding protein [Ilumatobacter sp.]|uniref:ABC transporter ATP-binding protein n=1 Tax=Ilumatobacter sp. TaxID=1967498 RepID=UPI00374FDD21
MSEPLLELNDLHVTFPVSSGAIKAVRGLDLTVHAGEVVGIVGESGSGKSASMLSVLGLHGPAAQVSGSVRFRGRELIGAPAAELRHLRGGRIGMIFQDPMTSLNPALTIGRQLSEAVIVHQKGSKRTAGERAIELLDMVSMPNPKARVRSYPHELSGGMRQRVMIAMAMANDPDLLIADEPTTALDVTTQAQILDVLRRIRTERHLAIAIITHDLGVVAGIADTVNVMYAGRIVERGAVEDVFYRHEHPYTSGLLACLPRLDSRSELVPIGGAPPALDALPPGCAFQDRCPHVSLECMSADVQLAPVGATEAACVNAPIRGAAR